MEAIVNGIPTESGYYVPKGAIDLRTAVYSPYGSFLESVKTSIAILFPEDFDPIETGRLAARIFSRKLDCVQSGNIFIYDLASGKSGTVYDYGANLLMASVLSLSSIMEFNALPFLAMYPEGCSREALLGRAVFEAWLDFQSDSERTMPETIDPLSAERNCRKHTLSQGVLPSIVLLRACGTGGTPRTSQGITHSGLHVVDVPVELDEIPELIQKFALEHPKECIPAIAENPAFFMASLILEITMFAEAKKDFSGELFFAHSSLDATSLSVSLWSWGLGLPVTGFTLGALSGTAQNFSADPFIVDFERIKPGILASLSVIEEMDASKLVTILAGMPEIRDYELDTEDRIAIAAGKQAILRADVSSSPESARIIARRTMNPEKHWRPSFGLKPPTSFSDFNGADSLSKYLRHLDR